MSATGAYRSIILRWTNPPDLDLARVQVWVSLDNDRANAVLADSPSATPGTQQRWVHTGREPGVTLYYWIRAEDYSGNLSGFTPSSATAGWSAAATAVSGGDLALRVVTLTDATPVTPNADTTDVGVLASLSQATTFNTPTGTPVDGQRLELRILSSTSRALTWQAGYRSTTGQTLPAATSGGSLPDYVVLRYHAADAKWDCILQTATTGSVAFASAGETTTGTETAKAVTPDGLAGSIFGTFVVTVQCSDPNGAALTTGNGKQFWRVPSVCNGMNLVAVAQAVTTVSSSGNPSFQVHNLTQAANMLSTVVSCDSGELDSSTATTAAVIDTANDDVATGDQLRFDCTVAGTGTKGAMVELHFRLP